MKLAILFLLFFSVSCVSDPGYESLYVGDGNLQWFVQPVAMAPSKGDSAVVDFTYRRIQGQENFVRVNLTWMYTKAPTEMPRISFELPGQEAALVNNLQVLFQERAKHLIRYTTMMKESDFLRLVKSPHGDLRVETDDETVIFPTSSEFEKILRDISIELS
jgi:hypothetical protein